MFSTIIKHTFKISRTGSDGYNTNMVGGKGEMHQIYWPGQLLG